MKSFVFVLSAILFTFGAHAESVDIKDINTDGEAETATTIEIKKGKSGKSSSEDRWEVTDGDGDVEGEMGATEKDARANWKHACQDWKKEVREDNKENKIINLNCGTAACSGQAGKMICTSKATYKIKTKLAN